MCGISGIFSFSDQKNQAILDDIVAMTKVIRHRGPDGEGYLAININNEPYFFSGDDTPKSVIESDIPAKPIPKPSNISNQFKLALGHRRLAILDISETGHQPLALSEKDALITFNGEIYNHNEIRNELISLGYSFFGTSDTEVVLNAYKKWGVKCLHKFNGMFSFIIIDIENEKVFVSRDRFGVKPCYFWTSPNGFTAVASEIKQFEVLPGWSAELNIQKAYEFLNYGLSDHSNETLFNGVFQLQGGEFIYCNFDELPSPMKQVQRWYELSAKKNRENTSQQVKKFKEIFIDAVKIRLQADVDVATSLSGGLDSSSIVCTGAKKINKKEYLTFSAGAKNPKFDESQYIKEVSKETNIKNKMVQPNINDFIREMDQILWHQDEPVTGASIFAEWEVFKLVNRSGIKVTLDGHGADEQLAGYHSFFGPFFYSLLRQGRIIKFFIETLACKKTHRYSWKQILAFTIRPLLKSRLLEPIRKLADVNPSHPNWLKIEGYSIKCGLDDALVRYRFIQDQSIAQLLKTSVPIQLHWCDRDSMAHGVESRTPFLDYRLVEHVLSCDDSLKINMGQTKCILREAMKNILPSKILNRQDKMGFVTPEQEWIQKDKPQLFMKLIKESVDGCPQLFNQNTIKKAEKVIQGKSNDISFIWRIILFTRWLNVFSVSFPDRVGK